VIAAARAVDSDGNPVELPTDQGALEVPGNGREVHEVEAEVIDPGSGADGSPESQGPEGRIPEEQVFEAEIVDEET
jgi:hypothetical protein